MTLRADIEKEEKRVSALNHELNELSESRQLDMKMDDLVMALARQRQILSNLQQQKEQEEAQILRGYVQQSRETQTFRQRRSIQLQQILSQLRERQRNLEISQARLHELLQANIATDALTQAQQKYEHDLRSLNQIQNQYREFDLQTRVEDDIQRRRENWQGRDDQQELNQKYREEYRRIQSEYDRLMQQYEALQEQVAKRRTKKSNLEHEYLESKRNLDEMKSEYESIITQPTLPPSKLR